MEWGGGKLRPRFLQDFNYLCYVGHLMPIILGLSACIISFQQHDLHEQVDRLMEI